MIKYLTGKELCEALGISTTLLYKFRKAGRIMKGIIIPLSFL